MLNQDRDSYQGGTGALSGAALKRISWGAVFAGVAIILAIQLALALLGAGIGLGAVDPVARDTPEASTFGTVAGIYWAISTLVSVLIGGWIAGRLAGIPRDFDGLIHGVLSWSVATLLTVYLLTTSIGSLIGGAFGIVGNVASGATQAAATAAPAVAGAVGDQLKESGIDLDRIKREAQALLSQTGKPALKPENIEQQVKGAASDASAAGKDAARAPGTAEGEFESLWSKIFQRGKGVAEAADREALTNVISARTGQSKEQAAETVRQWEEQYAQLQKKLEQQKQEAEQAAREAAERSAEVASRASLLAFLALVLGAGAGAIGGRMGRPEETLAVTRG